MSHPARQRDAVLCIVLLVQQRLIHSSLLACTVLCRATTFVAIQFSCVPAVLCLVSRNALTILSNTTSHLNKLAVWSVLPVYVPYKSERDLTRLGTPCSLSPNVGLS